jgi:hypothetical protein
MHKNQGGDRGKSPNKTGTLPKPKKGPSKTARAGQAPKAGPRKTARRTTTRSGDE